ncbi:MAG TPA: M3 family metallopeptidase, partial [Afifellaceae bacterium]|nr:M3 family metallopeptidase [Afifellaceae bacterium]
MDAPEIQADLEGASKRAEAFESRYRGQLAGITAEGGAGLADAIREFEEIEEVLGRLMSYAGLLYAGDTSDPARAKFYGDLQGCITDISTKLLFFTLEINRIADETMEAALADGSLAVYRPWIEDLRLERPYQLSDDIERLFHEKSLTGRSAWNRLFDETMSALRFDVDGEVLAMEPTLNLLQDPDGSRREAAAHALSETFSDNIRLFTLITNTLAKDKSISDGWRGFDDVAASRHLANRVEPEVVDALVSSVQVAYPRLSHRYYEMKAKWLGMERLNFWDRNAPLPENINRVVPWTEARDTVLSAYAGFAPQMAEIAGRFFDNGWIDAPTRPGKSPGAFSHPTVPSAHPYVLLNYQGKVRDV